MKKIIGGLLIVSLISKPSLLRADYLAYEVMKAHRQIIYVIRKETEESREDAVFTQIDDIMSDIGNQTRSITSLLKSKAKLMERMQTALDLRAHSKAKLDDTQLAVFTQFTDMYNTEGDILREILRRIDSHEHINKAQKAILHNDTDYNALLTELQTLYDDQQEALGSIARMIEMGEKTLQAL